MRPVSQPASKWKVLGATTSHRQPRHTKKPHNNDRKFCCSNMHVLLYGITWLHLLCGGDRWMRFTRLISSTKYKMCACVRLSLGVLRVCSVCSMHFLGVLNSMLSTVSLCSLYASAHSHTYISNCGMKTAEWNFVDEGGRRYVDNKRFVFSFNSFREYTRYILDKCEWYTYWHCLSVSRNTFKNRDRWWRWRWQWQQWWR